MTSLPILILPGTLCTGAMFTHQIETLRQHCNNVSVVQFTREATLSEMAALVINAAAEKPCAIIGFSMGGIVAAQVAKTHPQLIAKLALINSNSHADLPERKANRVEHIRKAREGQLVELIQQTFMPNYLYNQVATSQKIIVDMAISLGEQCFEAQTLAIEDRSDTLDVLKKITSDILLIGGLQDKICPAEHQFHMHKALPTSDLLLLGECGHFSPLDQTMKVSQALEQWYLLPQHKKSLEKYHEL
ncbi:alpha/beta fold hydrolase [Thalassotalea piscium]